jgi:hypothetical protein
MLHIKQLVVRVHNDVGGVACTASLERCSMAALARCVREDLSGGSEEESDVARKGLDKHKIVSMATLRTSKIWCCKVRGTFHRGHGARPSVRLK